MNVRVVVPTQGKRPGLLDELIRSSGLSAEVFFFVRTSPDGVIPKSAALADDFGPINIQRWWNAGLRLAGQANADYVVFANDDIQWTPATIPDLLNALRRTGATVATPGRLEKHFRKAFPLQWRLDGALWMMNTRHGFELDEDFRWWMGDRDMEARVRRFGRGVVTVPTNFTHTAGSATESRADLQQMLIADKELFARKHATIARAEWARAKWPAYRDWATRRARMLMKGDLGRDTRQESGAL